MPLKGIYQWKESHEQIRVSIPLKGAPASKADIFVTSSILKVNYAPYLIDILLHDTIEPNRHKAIVKDGVLKLTLFKKEARLWGKFEADENENDDAETRKNSLIEFEKEQGDKYKERKDRKLADEKFALRKQMKHDQDERILLEDRKQEEKSNAEEDMYQALSKLKDEEIMKAGKSSTVENTKKKAETEKSIFTSVDITHSSNDVQEMQAHYRKFEDIADIDENTDDDDDGDAKKDLFEEDDFDNDMEGVNEEEDEVRYVPPPRRIEREEAAQGKVDIKFTPRHFPTPMRESKQAEEDDWLLKNRRYLKKNKMLNHTRGSGVDISEEDPSWLKAKGDDFLRGGDVRSAINAYSAALDIDEEMLPCYANRAVCYLRMASYHDCAADCTAAIDRINAMTVEADSPEDTMRVKLNLRRGIARCYQGEFAQAVCDYHVAAQDIKRLTKEISGLTAEGITRDLEKLRMLRDMDELKTSGDQLVVNSGFDEAIVKYTEALEMTSLNVGCLSNRSACKMALGDKQGCIDDCTAALNILELSLDKVEPAIGETGSLNMLGALLPPPGSEKRKQWVMKTVLRRGACFVGVGKFDDAIRDYGTAIALDPKDEKLKSDLNKIKQAKAGKDSGFMDKKQ
jgi:dyslexia susceptibility 1 candidate gene 1 protein